jgi:BirA family biotin operon repressor/biotin-[acetyl-CoA-carboxylase] ligase
MYDLAALGAELRGTVFAGQVASFPTIDSTNTYALAQAQQGAPHGSVYLAGEQTAGRGRGGHQWHSRPQDGIYVSVLVRPSLISDRALWLSLIAGMAVKSVIEQATALAADIRWPNDVLLHGKKCAGILVESVFAGDAMRYAVIGIGLNVNHESFPEPLSQTATSLRIETGHPQSREVLLTTLLRALEAELAALDAGDDVLERFTAASSWVRNKQVSVAEDEGYTGVTCGLNPQGFLLVNTRNGIRTVRSGGVRPCE